MQWFCSASDGLLHMGLMPADSLPLIILMASPIALSLVRARTGFSPRDIGIVPGGSPPVSESAGFVPDLYWYRTDLNRFLGYIFAYAPAGPAQRAPPSLAAAPLALRGGLLH